MTQIVPQEGHRGQGKLVWMTDGAARGDPADLISCRELLRHLNHPRRLRGNRIARRVLDTSGQDVDRLPDTELAAFILRAVESTFDALSPRQQTIVRRCDLGGERYAEVARSLSISRRHAFREHNAAVRHILTLLAPEAPMAETRVSDTIDALWLQMAHARALEQNGNWQAAAHVLERIASEVDAGLRSFVETRLVRLYREVERFALAEDHLTTARKFVTKLGDRGSWQHAEVDVAAARLAEAMGVSGEADRLARRACVQLGSWLHTNGEHRIRDALIDALNLRAGRAFGQGDLSASAGFTSAAREAIGDGQYVDTQNLINAHVASAMVGWVRAGGWRACERELLNCHSLATRAGFTREAIIVATYLGNCRRLVGCPMDSVRLLTPLLATARAVGIGAPAPHLLYELISANLDAHAVETAGSYLAELRELASGDPLMQVHAELVTAKTHLAQRNYAIALRSAEAAESTFARSGRGVYAGNSLHLQAEALAGLGQKDRAIKTLRLAIEMLAGRSHPTKVGEAYHLLGKLSGETKYFVTARRLARLAVDSEMSGFAGTYRT